MTLQLTVIGLDRMGISFGLALAEQKAALFRCAHDPAASKIKNLETEEAFDKVFFRLSEAVKDADIVILNLPIDQMEATLKEMAEVLKEHSILINTSPANVAFFDLAKKYLPAERYYASMIPAINGSYLHEAESETQIPRVDLFRNAEMLIPTNPETHPDAVSMVSELTTLVGAHAFFVDPLEADGMLAKTDLLPKLSAAALLLSTMQQPGWQDTRKLASAVYAKSTDAFQYIHEEEHPGANALTNRENALLAIDGMLTALYKIRSLVDNQDQEALDKLFIALREDHSEWLDLRSSGDWEKRENEAQVRPPSRLGRLFGGNPGSKK